MRDKDESSDSLVESSSDNSSTNKGYSEITELEINDAADCKNTLLFDILSNAKDLRKLAIKYEPSSEVKAKLAVVLASQKCRIRDLHLVTTSDDWISPFISRMEYLNKLTVQIQKMEINDFCTLLFAIYKNHNLVTLQIYIQSNEAYRTAFQTFWNNNDTLFGVQYNLTKYSQVAGLNQVIKYGKGRDKEKPIAIEMNAKLQFYHFNWFNHYYPEEAFWKDELNARVSPGLVLLFMSKFKLNAEELPVDIVKMMLNYLDVEFKLLNIRILNENKYNNTLSKIRINDISDLEKLEAASTVASVINASQEQSDDIVVDAGNLNRDFQVLDTKRRVAKITHGVLVLGSILYFGGFVAYEFLVPQLISDTTTKAFVALAPIVVPITGGIVLKQTGLWSNMMRTLFPSHKNYDVEPGDPAISAPV